MRRVMLASVVGSAVALVAVAGYAAADVFDVAPGILTLDRPVSRADARRCPARRPRSLLPEPAAARRPAAHRHRRRRARCPTRAGLQRALDHGIRPTRP